MEAPHQTYKRILGKEWPGGHANDVVALLKRFNICHTPGTVEANIALQRRLLLMDLDAVLARLRDYLKHELLEAEPVESLDYVVSLIDPPLQTVRNLGASTQPALPEAYSCLMRIATRSCQAMLELGLLEHGKDWHA